MTQSVGKALVASAVACRREHVSRGGVDGTARPPGENGLKGGALGIVLVVPKAVAPRVDALLGRQQLGQVRLPKQLASLSLSEALAATERRLAALPEAIDEANAKWKAMLADYEAPPLDPAIDEALQAFMAKKKESLPDIWH